MKNFLILFLFLFSTVFATWPWDIFQQTQTEEIEINGKLEGEGEVVCPPSDSYSQTDCLIEGLGIFAIADWLNHSMIDLGLSHTKKSILNNNRCFTYFNTSHHLNVWIDSYLFHSHYRGGVNDFKLTTIGLETGGEYTFFDQIILGGGGGYYHSNLKKERGVEGIYLGPYVGYLFPQGSVGLALFWTRNYYHGHLESSDAKKSRINHHSWDRTFRLEGNYDFQLPEKLSKDLYLHPFASLDYLKVSESSYPIRSKVTIGRRKSSFFDLELGTHLSKTIICAKDFLLIPTLTIGWFHTSPFAKHKLVARASSKSVYVDVSADHKNQFLMGGQLLTLYRAGLLVELKYEKRIGSKAPLNGLRIRVEWNW